MKTCNQLNLRVKCLNLKIIKLYVFDITILQFLAVKFLLILIYHKFCFAKGFLLLINK